MKITKAILTGGGRATRLRPITSTINKHLIPLANRPMIFYAIQKAVDAGITDIFINVNPGEVELQKVVGSGGRWGVDIKYFEQKGGPKGIAHVVNCAKEFIGNDPFMFYLSDNIILGGLQKVLKKFDKENLDCLLSFAKVSDPKRFGVPVFDKAGNLSDIIEKPTSPPNNFAVTGIYLYGPKVFFESFKKIKPSPRGEYEISDIHSNLIKSGLKLGWQEITGWWKDTGQPEDLIAANKLLLDQMPASSFTPPAAKHRAQVSGNVHVGKRVKMGGKVMIIGPALIGDNCVLENCQIGPHVTLGDGAVVKNATIRESIVFPGATATAKANLFGSIISRGASIIGA